MMSSNKFNISQYLRSKGVSAEDKATTTYERSQTFKSIGLVVQHEIQQRIKGMPKEEGDKLLERQEKAITGDPHDMKYFIGLIKTILEEQNLKSNSFPSYYSSLEEAVFHEVYGLMLLQKWYNLYPDSEAAEFNGVDFRIEIDGELVLQEEKLEKIEDIYSIIRVFLMKYGHKFNEDNPILEVTMEDGSRVTVLGPPYHEVPVVTFRRFIVKTYSLEKQAELNTIAREDIPLFSSLGRTYVNILLAGKVRSAKTTFLKTLFGTRDKRDNVIVVEKNKELALARSFTNHTGSIKEFVVSEGELHDIYPVILRKEHDVVLIGEVRSTEIEAALHACERGTRGLMTTYHLTNVQKVVEQLARQVLVSYPNYTQKSQEERIAEAFDIIITMDKKRHSNKKKVTSVSEIYLESNGKVVVNTFVQLVGDRYVYSHEVSQELYEKMYAENPKEAEQFMKVLKERAAASPMVHKESNL
ncbi:ATPase, T2SS/T4P/T4SS family [Alcanivoracaceae bacterium MT1]